MKLGVNGGRPYNVTTNLGKLMLFHGWRVAGLSAETGINSRTICEYLAGRKRISVGHLAILSTLFRVPPEVLSVRQVDQPVG
jgi:hypothetical protein